MVRDGLVTSPPEKPKEDESGYLTWEAENSLVIVLLVNSMEQKIGRNYLSYKTARQPCTQILVILLNFSNYNLFSKTRNKGIQQLLITTTLSLDYGRSWTCLMILVGFVKIELTYVQKRDQQRLFDFLQGLNKELGQCTWTHSWNETAVRNSRSLC